MEVVEDNGKEGRDGEGGEEAREEVEPCKMEGAHVRWGERKWAEHGGSLLDVDGEEEGRLRGEVRLHGGGLTGLEVTVVEMVKKFEWQ